MVLVDNKRILLEFYPASLVILLEILTNQDACGPFLVCLKEITMKITTTLYCMCIIRFIVWAFELMDLSPWVQMLILILRQKHTAYSDMRAHYKSRKKIQSFIRHCEPDRSFLQAIGQVWRRTDISPSLTHSLQRQRLSLVTHSVSDSSGAAWCHPALPSAVVGQTVFYPITAITTQRREHIIYNVYYNDINVLRA